MDQVSYQEDTGGVSVTIKSGSVTGAWAVVLTSAGIKENIGKVLNHNL